MSEPTWWGQAYVQTSATPWYADWGLGAGPWAEASGYAVFTPSGIVNVSCPVHQAIWDDTDDNISAWNNYGIWPSGPFTRAVDCGTDVAGDPANYSMDYYAGSGRVVTNRGKGSASITCHLKYVRTEHM